jgi:PIN domain nuclease of toxin-antitoxin system
LKLLLDTHIWLWSLLDRSRLHKRVELALLRSSSELWLSPISIWETMMLHEKGRLILNEDARTWIARALDLVPVSQAPLTNAVALAARDIHLPHRDPADAFLAATAKCFELTLVTSDRRLLGCKGITTLSNLP